LRCYLIENCFCSELPKTPIFSTSDQIDNPQNWYVISLLLSILIKIVPISSRLTTQITISNRVEKCPVSLLSRRRRTRYFFPIKKKLLELMRALRVFHTLNIPILCVPYYYIIYSVIILKFWHMQIFYTLLIGDKLYFFKNITFSKKKLKIFYFFTTLMKNPLSKLKVMCQCWIFHPQLTSKYSIILG